MRKYIAPSILSADFRNLSQQIRLVEMGGADFIHCDIMDGHFVPNITFGPLIVQTVKSLTSLPVDTHLMIENPELYISDFVKAGSNFISVHQEGNHHLHRLISKIKDSGAKAGVVINPATPCNTLENILEYVDLVLVMTVNPGFGGQKFIESAMSKIAVLKKIRTKNNFNFLIEVDGGIEKGNIRKISDSGADIFVAGSSVFRSDDITASVVELKNLIALE
ncbi:MAG: ribulose-phosphate 3-epimerase [Ignavibacteriales bacterium]|nr:ribulose-phosphate 3-epimerase [Ignavibacteriales bacterium]MCF8435387.1 ribulose-phosphate 3-epimerase [Ignavibacteriales bacterium]